MTGVLDHEIAFFEAHRAEFLAKAPGKLALIKGETCAGFFDTDEAAFAGGLDRFGAAQFLIEEVQREQRGIGLPVTFFHGPGAGRALL